MRFPSVLVTEASRATDMTEIVHLPDIIELSESSNSAPSTAFELRSVTVNYGTLSALSGVSLRVSAGETVGLLGPSGSGKSTLLGVCGGRVPVSSGSVEVAGRPVAMSAQWQRENGREIGFIPSAREDPVRPG